ncbi:uncharacterized protein PHACADRAFT_151955 [Phanerochaete carnosa HHB-10118-sp]|uniref:FZ domain-containing protein n=1 Tax=Phanerochaete carnosa (strain HHB-10118-sp) TaxID=650164 RepID=K5UNJ3_PHACS|nr:uncharacterized protein PHACADRAFT_151955 [Phanerochaete carnosa HHB-10118-sp]EKM51296.1 hypothetical protein PHACADRAFT_151955 [Phanerochaete carnosa HHB-10118-sp]
MLPLALISLLQAQLAYSQSSVQLSLSLNSLYSSYSFAHTTRPTLFSLPTTQNASVSVALCSASNSSAPRFFLSNSSSITQPSEDDIGQDGVYEVVVGNQGYGWWTGALSEGGFLAVENAGQTSFQIGVSEESPMHDTMDAFPLLGDTASNQGLLFSPPLADAPPPNIPTYPNYTLPSANLSYPSAPPSLQVNVSVFVVPTSALASASMPLTACAMSSSDIQGSIMIDDTGSANNGLWLKDQDGWRWQWLVSGLQPQTNYTAYVVQNETKVSQPINFVTKSATFSCPIVHSLPYCPSIAYAVPLVAPQFPNIAYTANNLPSSVVSPLLEVLSNFTTSLLTFPCGRDEYSPLVSCADCQAAYRKWLCTIWFSRCSEAVDQPTNTDGSVQKPMSALAPQASSATPRSPGLQPFANGYTALLPCIETCTAADRACPNFIGFQCPVPQFNAALSYGVGFIDSGEEGVQGHGSTGVAQDRWGNVWCNAG